jgi:hypothetical protein
MIDDYAARADGDSLLLLDDSLLALSQRVRDALTTKPVVINQ